MASYRQRARSEGLLEYSKHRRKLQWCAFRAVAVPCVAAQPRACALPWPRGLKTHKHVATRSCGSVSRVGRSNTLSYLVEPHSAECYSRRLHPSPFIVNERLCGSGRHTRHCSLHILASGWCVCVCVRGPWWTREPRKERFVFLSLRATARLRGFWLAKNASLTSLATRLRASQRVCEPQPSQTRNSSQCRKCVCEA